ncbi:hypothetical protein, partial [Micromonospora sp. NPDC051141]|uniref:hypothetical protein n=1 Tax=Micromonospora sp. NPDC051141 TaxID=3364284 RepID=UPI0037A3FD8F
MRPGAQRDRGGDGADAGLLEQGRAEFVDQGADLGEVGFQEPVEAHDLLGEGCQLSAMQPVETAAAG